MERPLFPCSLDASWLEVGMLATSDDRANNATMQTIILRSRIGGRKVLLLKLDYVPVVDVPRLSLFNLATYIHIEEYAMIVTSSCHLSFYWSTLYSPSIRVLKNPTGSHYIHRVNYYSTEAYPGLSSDD